MLRKFVYVLLHFSILGGGGLYTYRPLDQNIQIFVLVSALKILYQSASTPEFSFSKFLEELEPFSVLF